MSYIVIILDTSITLCASEINGNSSLSFGFVGSILFKASVISICEYFIKSKGLIISINDWNES